ncbi:hypothetical protein BZM27_12690 [Paraburkholderia steynii]|uniref:Uncharacterized protein n=1 Tax=Paraburkholderia steynii TaxID=1245441 RepID=A0A4R0XDS1_9BURK|nr:hypothetical protein BZM27_12690 [Paraburkholderia steynii]
MQLAISVVGAVVGGVIGFYAGGPSGAVYGAELGFALGGIAGSLLVHQKGPSPSDLRVQDSAYGRPIPWYYGVYRGAGNVIWCGQALQHQESAGKGGGPSQSVVTLSFAVGICEGPIVGVRRIWANGKLIYDMSNPSNFEAVSGSNQMVQNFKLYLGDENQLADPTIQAAEGVANTPPFRGLAYVVFNDLDLSSWGNYMPSLSFEVFKTAALSYTKGLQYDITKSPAWDSWAGNSVVRIDEAGNMYGWQYGQVGSFFQAQAFKVSPYGVTEFLLGTPLHTTFDGPYQRFQNYDGDDGIAFSSGNYYVPSAVAVLAGRGGPFSTFWMNQGNAVKKGGIIYGAISVASVPGPLLIWNPTLGAYDSGSYVAMMAVVGVSDSYVYVATDGTAPNPHALVKLTLGGDFVAVLATDAQFGLSTVGYFISDSQIYLNYGPTVRMWNGSALVDTGVPADSSGNLGDFRIYNDTGYFSSWFNPHPFYAQVPTLNPSAMVLSDVISDICTRAGLSSAQYDVSGLTDQVLGCAVANHSSPRANAAPLMSAYFVDANDTDNKLKFVRRGAQPVGTFYYADLGSSPSLGDDANMTPITEQIAQEVDLPRSLAFTYSSFGTDYQVNTQTAFMPDTSSNKDVTAQATIVLTDNDARLRAQSMLWAAWVGRKSFTLSTSLAYLQYEPGDVMWLHRGDGSTVVVRITRCVLDGQGSLQWEVQLEQPDIYPNGTFSVGGGRALGYSTPPIDYGGPTILRILDIPPLRDIDSTPGVYLAACGLASNWPGAMVDVSRDGSSYSQLTRILRQSSIGYATTKLGDYAGGNTPDELNKVTVLLYAGALSSVSYSDFMLGNSAAYLGGEIIFFRDAVLIAANTYRLSGLLRARAGTDFAKSTHAAGEAFVFLDVNALVKQSINVSDIGNTLYYEPHLLNIFANQPVSTYSDQITDGCVQPLPPHLFRANPGSISAANDITLSWFRRARVFYQWVSGADVPLDQQTEAYMLTISDGSGNVKRTVTVSAATSYIYSAANISTDGFTTGNTINFKVTQNSDLGVTGMPAITSIVR